MSVITRRSGISIHHGECLDGPWKGFLWAQDYEFTMHERIPDDNVDGGERIRSHTYRWVKEERGWRTLK